MPTNTLPAFSASEFDKALLYLATQVAEMMGRKFEEGDWSKVYCSAKNIPMASWSNLSIDVMHGNLGVEQKMICRRQDQTILEACGTRIMHPAGTRAIRIPVEEDATKAARIVLRQYVELIELRTKIVEVVHRYHHGRLSATEAMSVLRRVGMSTVAAKAHLPNKLMPQGTADASPDMRVGWLLWKENLHEFLYFEEPMTKPNPEDYVAEWRDSGGGRRKKSRNLWVFHKVSGEKAYSITTEAGAKIQPYFTVPPPKDPNLYHFVVQGEDCGNGLVRVWLTKVTASLLAEKLGELKPDVIAAAVDGLAVDQLAAGKSDEPFGPVAVEVFVPASTYFKLQTVFKGVSDEHNFRQLVEILRAS